MAFFELHFRSKSLNTTVSVNVILPDNFDDTYKTLYLLHGASGNYSSWMSFSSIERYAQKHNIAVVMPDVENSWYADTAYGAKYFTFVAEELPKYCRKHFRGMTDCREDNFIGGLSMGGYGALKIALTYPERYFACISLSGSLDITRKTQSYKLDLWKANFGFDLESALQLENTENDIYYLAKKLQTDKKQFPNLFLWCGTEDSLIEINRNYRDLLTELKAPLEYRESEGNHSWKWWDMHIENALNFILNQ